MKKPLFVMLILSFGLSACLPGLLSQPSPTNGAGEVSQVNIQETAAAMAGTMAVQTIAAMPTPTLVTPTRVVAALPTPTATGVVSPNVSATAPTSTLSPTPTAALSTPTTIPFNLPTQTQIPGSLGAPTADLHPRFYGTLPPSLPYGFVTLSNKSKVEAYISLQCTTPDGYVTIIEYPVKGTFDIKVPAGRYEYVAWIGGRKMIGKFSLSKMQELYITLYKDKVSVKQ